MLKITSFEDHKLIVSCNRTSLRTPHAGSHLQG